MVRLRLKEEYGEKAKGNVSYSKIKVDISAERSKEKNNNEGNTIDLQIQIVDCVLANSR